MDYRITPAELKKARLAFEKHESRDLFYRAALELVGLALQGKTSLTLTEALAVLLQTWNKAYYQYRKFDSRHFADIEKLLEMHSDILDSLRAQSIRDFTSQKETSIKKIFGEFETVLGPVGAAKVLHLLAPDCFPLWDRAIAKAYRIKLTKTGSNGGSYWEFISISKNQCAELGHNSTDYRTILKSIDEFNYCKYTKKWVI